jgi:hypothetical protein
MARLLAAIRPCAVLPALSLAIALLGACGKPGTGSPEPSGVEARADSSGQCEGNCDASPPSIPKLLDTAGFGDVTTYGDVAHPAPSAGGACNYGPTGILNFAAIQVDRLPGDAQGQWRGGRVCGQCAEVRARTPTGWKTTVVRIVDKCPDANCGIDLGGQPARDLMGDRPGRYSGEWTFVSCEGRAGVSDGEPSLFVKEGTNAWWSRVQARNPAERITGMRIRPVAAGANVAWTDMDWATEAENFFGVPDPMLQDTALYELQAILPHGAPYSLRCRGTALAQAGTFLPFAPRSP